LLADAIRKLRQLQRSTIAVCIHLLEAGEDLGLLAGRKGPAPVLHHQLSEKGPRLRLGQRNAVRARQGADGGASQLMSPALHRHGIDTVEPGFDEIFGGR
jgi:hypothetical protein